MAAQEVAARLANEGIGFMCPHLNSAHFEVITPDVTPEYWYELDLKLMAGCDAVYMMGGWQNSKGSVDEQQTALQNKQPVFYTDEFLDMIAWAKNNA